MDFIFVFKILWSTPANISLGKKLDLFYFQFSPIFLRKFIQNLSTHEHYFLSTPIFLGIQVFETVKWHRRFAVFFRTKLVFTNRSPYLISPLWSLLPKTYFLCPRLSILYNIYFYHCFFRQQELYLPPQSRPGPGQGIFQRPGSIASLPDLVRTIHRKARRQLAPRSFVGTMHSKFNIILFFCQFFSGQAFHQGVTKNKATQITPHL